MQKKPAQVVHYCGIVTILEKASPAKGKTYHELRYLDPATGRDVKRRVSGMGLDKVKEIAGNLNRQAHQGKGWLAGQPKAPALGDVFAEVIRLARAGKRVKAMYTDAAELFMVWLAGQYPAVKTFDQLRPAMILAYVRQLESGGRAWDTIRNRLVPIKAAWKHAAENWPDLVRPLPSLKLAIPPRREIQCLEADELAAVLAWFKARRPALYPLVCLQGRAGLRMMEAAALRIQDTDLKAGTVTVTKTDQHTPKTRDSFRTIPICGEVLAALKVAAASQKVRPATGELFMTAKGTFWTITGLSGRMRAAFKAAANDLYRQPEKVKLTAEEAEALGAAKARFLAIPPRKLRAAFATLASRQGAQDRILKAYLGHSAGDILGDHYRKVSMDELQLVSGLMEGAQAAPSARLFGKDSGNNPIREIVNG